MKTRFLAASILILGLAHVNAQFGPRGGGMAGPPSGPRLGGDMARIFGEHSAFSANLELHTSGTDLGKDVTMPGKIAYLQGKSRFEMNMSEMKGAKTPSDAASMKEMGMDQMIMISRPDKQVDYLVLPGMKAYVESPIQDADAARPESESKLEVTELGKEKVDGHDCVKNKVVVTDKDGKARESTVWNATDQKKFPVKIETTDEEKKSTVMLFKDVKLDKPEAGQFDPPAGFTKYDNFMSMMQQEMMKKMGGMGFPPR